MGNTVQIDYGKVLIMDQFSLIDAENIQTFLPDLTFSCIIAWNLFFLFLIYSVIFFRTQYHRKICILFGWVDFCNLRQLNFRCNIFHEFPFDEFSAL